MISRGNYLKNEKGGATAEFALVALPFMILVFTIIYLSLMFYANQTLQYAAEAAARCYSVNDVSCATPGAAQAYAANRYSGPNISPVFVATTGECGYIVTGTANFPLRAVVVNTSVPLSATACFP